jgi:uncharacterized membrane protein
MTSKRFVIGDVLGFGWRIMAANLWFFVGLALVAGLLRIAPKIITDLIPYSPGSELFIALALVTFIIAVGGWFISIVINIGFIKIALCFCNGRKPPFGTLFDFQGCFWRYVGTTILCALIVMVGASLIFIPAILVALIDPEHFGMLLIVVPLILTGIFLTVYLSIKYSLCQYFVIDKGLGPVQAIKASGRTTRGVMWKLFGFRILGALIILLGLLCLFVGVFAAYPIVMVAHALVYRHLAAQTPELAEFGIDNTTYSAAAQQSPVT